MLQKICFILILLSALFIPRSFLSNILVHQEIHNNINTDLLFEKNKLFIADYKSQCLAALSFYPELENVTIEFREAAIGTTMAARPIVSSFFNLNYERKYQIIFNNASTCEVPFSELPANGQIGILGHELAHILDFEKKSLGEIILTGCFYSNSHSIRNYERKIDNVTLERGFGKKLFEAYHYILEDSQASEEYKNFKRFSYLKPFEILQFINRKKINTDKL